MTSSGGPAHRSVADGVGIVYILLPIHNRRAVTEAFVRCLLEQEDRAFHLVLIDDGSTDGSAELVTRLLPQTTVIRGRGNWWWAGSLEQGYRWLRMRELRDSDLVLIANDDTGFDATFIRAGREVMGDKRRVMLLARLHDRESGALLEVGVHADWSTMTFTGVLDPDTVNCFSTRGLFMFAREFVALGGFHPRLLPHYGSDYEFTIRAWTKGCVLRSDPSVRLWYDETTTGIRVVSRSSVRAFLRATLTIRSVANPIYLTTLVLLACPRRYQPRNVVRVWRSFLSGLRASMRGA